MLTSNSSSSINNGIYTFNYEQGAVRAFAIPRGVRSLEITVAGGRGADKKDCGFHFRDIYRGGKGAQIEFGLSVHYYKEIYLRVGAYGGLLSDARGDGETLGGGASDVRRVRDDFSTSFVVAAGGGASGCYGSGGAGGLLSGDSGEDQSTFFPGTRQGRGGLAVEGGESKCEQGAGLAGSGGMGCSSGGGGGDGLYGGGGGFAGGGGGGSSAVNNLNATLLQYNADNDGFIELRVSGCIPGFGLNNTKNGCTVCPPGKYGSGYGPNVTISCQDCPAGMFFPFMGASSCSGCPAGKRSVNGAAVCCPLHSIYRDDFKNDCVVCPERQTGDENMTLCIPDGSNHKLTPVLLPLIFQTIGIILLLVALYLFCSLRSRSIYQPISTAPVIDQAEQSCSEKENEVSVGSSYQAGESEDEKDEWLDCRHQLP